MDAQPDGGLALGLVEILDAASTISLAASWASRWRRSRVWVAACSRARCMGGSPLHGLEPAYTDAVKAR
jgi:hypothetical protein